MRRTRGPPERALRIAKPILLVSTPVGVVWGIAEAARFHWWLAVLMTLLVGVIGAFFWMTVRRIRLERDAAARAAGGGPDAPGGRAGGGPLRPAAAADRALDR